RRAQSNRSRCRFSGQRGGSATTRAIRSYAAGGSSSERFNGNALLQLVMDASCLKFGADARLGVAQRQRLWVNSKDTNNEFIWSFSLGSGSAGSSVVSASSDEADTPPGTYRRRRSYSSCAPY